MAPLTAKEVNGAISAEGLHDRGRAPCHFLTMPWHLCTAEEGDYHNSHAYHILRGLSPHANYTDRAAAAGRRS